MSFTYATIFLCLAKWFVSCSWLFIRLNYDAESADEVVYRRMKYWRMTILGGTLKRSWFVSRCCIVCLERLSPSSNRDRNQVLYEWRALVTAVSTRFLHLPFIKSRTKRRGRVVSTPASYSEGPGSNIDQKTVYPDWGFLRFFSVPTGNIRDISLHRPRQPSTFFPIHHSLIFFIRTLAIESTLK
jgi:hypothetical protein